MKNILMLILCVCTYCISFAQAGENKKSVFQLSFFPPLSTNGLHSPQYTNKSSLNLLVGISENEEAFTFGGLSNIILSDATGVQFAGLFNYTGKEGNGFQFAGLANVNRGNLRGLQLAGLINTSANIAGSQFSGLINIAQDVKDFQFAGLFNYAGGEGNGFQFAGLMNKNKHKFSGFQFSGLVNNSADMNGFQFAGLVNIAKNVKGVQFAGLVNIAENSDCPIGLINIIKNGEKGIAVTYNGIGNVMASFRSGGKYTYGILGAGYNHKMEKNNLVAEGGFGAHIPVVKWFKINNEIVFSSIGCDSSEPVFNVGYSLIPAFRIGGHIELFAGVSINYMESKNMSVQDMFPSHSLWRNNGFTKLQQLYIGYQFGIQYIF